MAEDRKTMPTSTVGGAWGGPGNRTAPLVIAHFDAHGTATGTALARAVGGQVLIKFPDTGPQRVAQLLTTLDAYGRDVYVVDIPIDVANPNGVINAYVALKGSARNVYFIDHHDTDIRYIPALSQAGVNTLWFKTASDMAKALSEHFGADMGLLAVGVTADRDRSILTMYDKRYVETQLLPLANALDVLVRQNLQETVNGLMSEGLSYIQRIANQVQYPPYSLVGRLAVQQRGWRTLMLQPIGYETQLSMWLPKTVEYLLQTQGMSYAVFLAEMEDPRTKQRSWTVRVLKYWLADGPSAETVVKSLQLPYQYVGHEDYVSLRVPSLEEGQRIAQTIFEELEGRSRIVAHMVNISTVRDMAEGIMADYKQILHYLERIAAALERGASAKEQQVELLRQMRPEQRRYD